VYDQGSLGACTAHALVGAVEYLSLRQQREGVPVYDAVRPSRLGLYWDERNTEGTLATDAGAVLSDGVGVLGRLGWRTEDEWPYDVTRFADAPAGFFLTQRLTSSTPLGHDVDEIRYKLALGYPVAFGAAVFEQIMDAPNGAIALPSGDSIGGHAMLLVGYDDDAQVFLVRNSWGTSWGDNGYGTIPYAYIRDATLTDEVYSMESIRPMP
jgi:C1A family cysteine protease